MTIDQPQPNVRDLQRDVVNLLADIEKLMQRASESFTSGDAGEGHEKFTKFKEEVAAARRNVENLELVMSIVAPMKAGKSTIINAIVGQELLPSRAAAMTTLPTKIILKADQAEPVLEFDRDTRSVLKTTLSHLQKKIQNEGIEQIISEINNAKYGHLSDLIPKIASGIKIPEKVTGIENIKETLTDVNDLVRVCSVLEPSQNPLNKPNFSIPCISTPFRKITSSSQDDLLGHLVIVDTPGPNEAGENLQLSNVVDEQLSKSSMILIVLDFTQLNNQAAEEIKRKAQKIIEKNKKNLYVLINKIDQRNEDEPMTPERVKKFVLADLELGEEGDEGRIFEVSARRAFYATSFLAEVQQNPDAKKDELKTARALAEQTLGTSWKKKFDRCSLEDLKEEADILWEESFFDIFLENAIDFLIKNAAPRCIESSLKRSQKKLEDLKKDVSSRSKLITEEEEKIRKEIGGLESDLEELDNSRQQLQDIYAKRDEIKAELDKILDYLKKIATLSLEDYFKKEIFNFRTITKKFNDFFGQCFSAIFNSISKLPGFDWDKYPLDEESKNSGKFKFDNELEAEKFANDAIAYSRKRLENIFNQFIDEMVCKNEKDIETIEKVLDQKLKPIKKKAEEHQKSLNIELSLPKLNLNKPDDNSLGEVQYKVDRSTKRVDGGYEEIKVMKREFWHWFWLVPFEVTERRKRPHKEVNYYTVSLEDLISEMNDCIEESIKNFKIQSDEYFDRKCKQKIDEYFYELDKDLKEFINFLEQSLRDKKLSEKDQEILQGELNLIVENAQTLIEECSRNTEYVASIIKTQK